MRINDKITYRPVDPKKDLMIAYNIFRETVGPYVIELNGSWPEKPRYDFFKKGFMEDGMHMLICDNEPIGCFCITESDEAVILQRMYFDPAFQRQGIGQSLMALAQERAHEAKKPLELEVLLNNKPAYNAYIKNGFEAYEAKYNYEGQLKKVLMRHKNTERYMNQSQTVNKTGICPVQYKPV